MILNHRNDPVQLLPEFQAFCKTVSLKESLTQYCKNKHQGATVFDIFCTLFFPRFSIAELLEIVEVTHSWFNRFRKL